MRPARRRTRDRPVDSRPSRSGRGSTLRPPGSMRSRPRPRRDQPTIRRWPRRFLRSARRRVPRPSRCRHQGARRISRPRLRRSRHRRLDARDVCLARHPSHVRCDCQSTRGRALDPHCGPCALPVREGVHLRVAQEGDRARPAQTLDVASHRVPIPAMPGRIRIGTQGWAYDVWAGPFYPPRTRPADYLTVYARGFETVEVDSTFYAIPAAKTMRGWAQRTPDDFTFALKLPQEITHERRLRNTDEVTAEFFDRARELGNKLGPVLIQLGPDFGITELPAVAQFLPKLPRDIRFAIEFRQRAWIHDGVLALLAEHNVALTLSDGRWLPRKQMMQLATRPTADFLYVRWMGADQGLVDYSRIQIDRTRELEPWTGVLWPHAEQGRDVYGYANNQFAGHAPESARELQRLLGQQAVQPEDLGEQMSLF